jgi:hypothetical protein
MTEVVLYRFYYLCQNFRLFEAIARYPNHIPLKSPGHNVLLRFVFFG